MDYLFGYIDHELSAAFNLDYFRQKLADKVNSSTQL